MAGRLAWAEAESLPFDDATFDACWTVGGFNYFRDHAAALREMRRVTRPGGPVVVADEVPDLIRAGLGHLIGVPAIDAWWLALPGARPRVRRHGAELRRRPRSTWRGRVWPGSDPASDLARAGLLFRPSGRSVIEGEARHVHGEPRASRDVAMGPGAGTSGDARSAGALRDVALGAGDGRAPAAARGYPIDDGILVVKDRTRGQQRGRAGLLQQPALAQVPVLGEVHWFCNGGERRARNVVLRHLPDRPQLELLDVAIGDGVYLDWLPKDWRSRASTSRDRSSTPAAAAPRRPAATSGSPWARPRRCRWPTASSTPCSASAGSTTSTTRKPPSARWSASARPGATIVVSDEMPNLTDRMLGHKLGIPALDRWIVSRLMHLGDAFTEMVERYRDLDVPAIARRVLPDCRDHPGLAGRRLRPGRTRPE